MTTTSPARSPSPFHIRDFNLLYLGRFFGNIGVQMLSAALGWQIYAITHDPFAIGMIGLCQFVPSILLALFSGEVADQFDRKHILATTHALCAMCGALLLLSNFYGFISPIFMYVVAVGLGVARIFGGPASNALLPNVVPDDLFSKAVAINSTAFQFATIFGPTLAGFTFIAGASAVYGIATITLAAAGISAFSIKTRSKGIKRTMNVKTMLAGIHFIKERPVLFGAITLDLFAVFFGGVVALLPVYAKDILHAGAQEFGFLRSAPAVGAALMSIVLSWKPLTHKAGLWLFGSVMVFALATIVFGVSTNLLLSLAMLLLLGAADMISVFVRNHLMQKNTPDDMRGRVASVSMLFITTSNELGDFESGVMASWFGAVPAVVIGGVLSLCVVGLVAWRIPSLYKMDRLDKPS